VEDEEQIVGCKISTGKRYMGWDSGGGG